MSNPPKLASVGMTRHICSDSFHGQYSSPRCSGFTDHSAINPPSSNESKNSSPRCEEDTNPFSWNYFMRKNRISLCDAERIHICVCINLFLASFQCGSFVFLNAHFNTYFFIHAYLHTNHVC